jgi:hypothetical protein
MAISTLNAFDGERRKLAAFAHLAARREALIDRARRALLSVLIERAEATADDVRELIPLPPGINAKVFGAVPSVLAETGIIVADGFAKSTRPEAHARPVQRWRLADRDGAKQWLRTHPDLPDVEPEIPENLFDFIHTKKPGAGTPGDN